jgi:hypothetical protein
MLQKTATQNLGRYGLFYVAALFSVLHFGYRSFIDVIFVFGVGIVFGLLVQRTGSIIGVSLAHGLTNIALYLIFPLLITSPMTRIPGSPAAYLTKHTTPAVEVQDFPTQTRLQSHRPGQYAAPSTGPIINSQPITIPPVSAAYPADQRSAVSPTPARWAHHAILAGSTGIPRNTSDWGNVIDVHYPGPARDKLDGQQLFLPVEIIPSRTACSRTPL